MTKERVPRNMAVLASAAGLAAMVFMAAAPPSPQPIHDRPEPNAEVRLAAVEVRQAPVEVRQAPVEVRQTALDDPSRKVVVSLQQRRLWLVEGGDTVFSAPIAIGKGGVFQFAGNSYRFDTPQGERRILAKHDDPNWIPPDWHYYEKAVRRNLEPVHLEDGDRIELSDGTFIEVREKEVGRVNRWGNFHAFTPGSEIIFDGNIYIPPFGSPQRMVPNALGPVKLSLGDGYLIHGTHRYNQESIGSAASHGCIRMRNEDVALLRDMVEVGTRVYIY